MAIRRRVLVSGHVQGGFFRETCRDKAESLGVAGSARNLPDGRFEAIFEGDPDAVEQLVRWCREGPSSARVQGVEVIEEEPRGERSFSVS